MANNPNDPNNQNINQPKIDTNQPQQSRQAGTGFTNIGRILGANVGAGQKLAGRIGGSIAGQGQRVRQGLGQAQQQFETGFQQARQGALANIQAGQALAKQPGETDEAYEARVASSGSDFGKIGQGVKSATYTGPMGFENPNILLSQAQSAGKLGAFTRSGIGQGILARQYGASRGASYGAGQNVLDQMFLSQDPTAQKTLQQARQSVMGLGKQVGQASEAAMQSAQSTQEGIEQDKAKALGAIQTSAKGIMERGQQSAQKFYDDAQKLQKVLASASSADFDPAKLSQEERNLLLRAEEFGVPLSNIKVDIGDSQRALSNRILSDIAMRGQVTNAGAPKLTQDQMAAYKNLASLQGMAAPKLSEFDTKVFPGSKDAIQGSLADLARSQEQERQRMTTLELYNKYNPYHRANTYEDIAGKAAHTLMGSQAANYEFWKNLTQSAHDPTFSKTTTKPGGFLGLGSTSSTQTQRLPIAKLRQYFGETEGAVQRGQEARQVSLGDYIKNLYKLT